MNLDKRLQSKVAIVTGAGKGIGAAIVRRFLAEGIQAIALFDYDYALVKKTAEILADETEVPAERVLPVFCDVGNPDDVHVAVAQVYDKFNNVDVLVNNAGITRDRMFHKMERTAWDEVIRVNLSGVYSMCSEVFPIMREKNDGHIINITSTSAWGNIGQANYSASKAGIVGLTRTLALEGGRKNIKVNCIAPGYIETDMFATIPEDVLEKFSEQIPLCRLGKPEEIASVAAFLASDDASYITGQCLFVSGGSLML